MAKASGYEPGWISLRKGTEGVHVTYGHSFSNNLVVRNVRVRDLRDAAAPVELYFDLSKNLGRARGSNERDDVEDLLEHVGEVALFQWSDARSLAAFAKLLAIYRRPTPAALALTLDFADRGRFTFDATVAWNSDPECLVLEPLTLRS